MYTGSLQQSKQLLLRSRVWKVGGSNPGRVKSKTEQLAPVAFLICVHYLRPWAGLVGPVSVK